MADLIVAVGLQGLVTTSTNGVLWTDSIDPLLSERYGVAWGNNLFVAAGGYAGNDVYYTSTDGTTWGVPLNTGLAYTMSLTWHDAAFGAGYFILVGDRDGYSTNVAAIYDGISWVESSPPTDWFGSLYGVKYVNGKFVTGDHMQAVHYCTPGGPWTDVYPDPSAPPYPASGLTHTAYKAPTYVISGSSGYIFSTTDLASWALRTSAGPGDVNAIASGAGVFAIAGQNKHFQYSPTGAIWTLGTPGPIGDGTWRFNDMIWVPSLSLFVAVGGNSGGSAEIWTSSNGINWSLAHTAPVAMGFCYIGVCLGQVTTGPTMDQIMRGCKWFNGGSFQGMYLGWR